jgi:hypothetical protein
MPKKSQETQPEDSADNGLEELASSTIVNPGPAIRRALPVRLSRTDIEAAPDLLLWFLIEESAKSLSFNNYQLFIDYVLCGEDLPEDLDEVERARIVTDRDQDFTKTNEYLRLKNRRFLPFTDTDAYRLLKVATESFLVVNCAVFLEGVERVNLAQLLDRVDASTSLSGADFKKQYLQNYLKAINGSAKKTLPYLEFILRKFPDLRDRIKGRIFRDYEQLKDVLGGNGENPEDCYGLLEEKLVYPCMIELIWSYWHEQGMLVQTMNAISRRFQNIRGPAEQDPLAGLELDPLRPLNNLIWGYIQDEQHRLSLVRRAYEYDHHYGLTLVGKAVPPIRPADSRSRFLEAFHNLLYLVSVFYKQDDDTTIEADAFPVLKALEDLHLLLSEGAHNQFGDLPATARTEMLMQQWLLARPEFRQVLPTRTMVAYPEPWMDRVDAMKRLQKWIDASVLHFRNLGAYGEQILLSVRFGAWADPNNRPDQAKIWARFWRSQIQGYIHAYRAVTGLELTAEITTTQQRTLITTKPSVLFERQLEKGRVMPALPAATPGAGSQPSFRNRRAARRNGKQP